MKDSDYLLFDSMLV